jgi:hypothetical protein
VDEREDKERMMALTVVSKHKEPEIINAVPLAAKHPIISYTHGIRDGSEAFREFKRTNGLYYKFIRFSQMMFWMDSVDATLTRSLNVLMMRNEPSKHIK